MAGGKSRIRLTPPLHDRSQPVRASASRIRIQRRPTASDSAGGPVGRCSHWASKRTRNPAGDRSRHAKLSFTEQPGVAVSISARTASPDAVGSSVTASGYCGGGRRSAAQTSARNPVAMPCRPQTMAHHSALLRAAARTRFSPRSPSITWTRIDHPPLHVQGYHGDRRPAWTPGRLRRARRSSVTGHNALAPPLARPTHAAPRRRHRSLRGIELGSRRVHVLGVTRNPESAWVTQQARNISVGEGLGGVRFPTRDRDSKYSGPFDEVFRTEGIGVIKTRSSTHCGSAPCILTTLAARQERPCAWETPRNKCFQPWPVPEPASRSPRPDLSQGRLSASVRSGKSRPLPVGVRNCDHALDLRIRSG
jgi:hypothetical protein